MFLFQQKKMEMVGPDAALPGRSMAIPTAETHFVNGRPLDAAVPDGLEEAMIGMG